MKRILLSALVILFVFTLCSCSFTSENSGSGEVSVFYYTFSDTYISSVRTAMDKLLGNAGVNYNDYDANGNQTTQTEQIQTAIAKGCRALIVNVVDTGSDDAAQNIISMAKEKDIPVIFFNRSVNSDVINSYDKCVFIGTDYEMAGHLQGEMIGNYLVKNFEKTDINGDGKISYVLFKGQEGNLEAIARTSFSVEDCDKILAENGLEELFYYDSSNKNKYLVDQDGLWSSAAATNYMSTILAQYSERNGNMVELVIANNDEMALGAVSALQSAGYNLNSDKFIPVFGIDATDAAKNAISSGSMTGTIKQDADGMAQTMVKVLDNFINQRHALDGINEENLEGEKKVNIPYSQYLGSDA